MLDPTGLVDALGIVVRPVDDAAALIPLVLAIELDDVPDLDRSDALSEIDIMSHQ
jgi:hypothetical protein